MRSLIARRQFTLRWLLFVFVPAVALIAVVGKGCARPMYCNWFGFRHEFQLVPGWEPSYYLYDSRKRVGWSDFTDNAILLVLATENHRSPWSLQPGFNTARVILNDEGSFATVARRRNVLVVVRQDGELCQFPIGVGLSQKFYDQHVFQNNTMCPDLVAAARKLLTPTDRKILDDFVADERNRRS